MGGVGAAARGYPDVENEGAPPNQNLRILMKHAKLRGGAPIGQFTNFISGVVWALVGTVLWCLGLKCDN